METVVITVEGGVASVEYSSPGVDVNIFDMDNNSLYLYKDKYICTLASVNDDGTVDLVCVDTSDGSPNNKYFNRVPVKDVEYYGDDDDGEFLEEEVW